MLHAEIRIEIIFKRQFLMKWMTKNMIAKAYCFKRAKYLYFLTVDLKLNIHFKL